MTNDILLHSNERLHLVKYFNRAKFNMKIIQKINF